jgi:uncharacterized protein (TIGR00299 family) protein
MKVLHFDCFAGISGDMALGAFVDLGVDPDELRNELGKLGLEGWKLECNRDSRNGIGGVHAMVDLGGSTDHLAQEEDHHDHHHHEHDQHEHHEHHAHYHHEHHERGADHEHHHDHSGHAHNSWKEIHSLIERSSLREGAKKRSLDIFSRIAEAESQVHGVPVEDIAFHEVGALDSIIDIAGAAICLDLLNPEKITAGEIELGGGTVKCAHGILPVPAPATQLLVRGLPVRAGGFDREMTTPTGAAILASCVDEFITGPVSFKEIKTGTGIGSRKLDKPNILRVSWRETGAAQTEKPWLREELTLLEANIDDMTGEALGFLMERLFSSGALDVSFIPCTMKKSRPGVVVSALGRPDSLDALRETFFRYSTTIGFRERAVNRLSLKREEKILPGPKGSSLGEAREKTVFLGGERLGAKIEFEDRARLAREKGVSLEEAERLLRGGEGRG